MSRVLLAVPDASGDPYAADFVLALRAERPATRFLGLGGVEMEKAGVELIVHQRDMAVGGFLELLPDLPRIAAAWRRLGQALRRARPDLAVLVDSSGFNLPFARRARRAGVPVLYYVSPQVWAWRRGRIRRLARRADRIALILPFEAQVYREAGVAAEFVGHPLVDRLAARRGELERGAARRRLGLAGDAPVVALLPGSRPAEVRHCLPLHLESARALHAREPGVRFALPLAPAIERAPVERTLAAARLPEGLRLELVAGRSLEVLAACDAALMKPGTATLEAALLDRPLVVAARIGRVSGFLWQTLARVDSTAMPNLIAGAEVVPEFLQGQADPERIADAVLARLRGPEREAQRRGLELVRARLGGGGAARRTAAIAGGMLDARGGP